MRGRPGASLLGGLIAVVLLFSPGTAGAGQTCAGAETRVSVLGVEDAERVMLCLVNLHRAANGVGELAMEPALQRAARGHSEHMIARGHFCHSYTPEGCDEYRPGDPQTTPTSRAEAEGYRGGIGENIAADRAPGVTPQSMFGQWRDSPGHNDNMLDRHGITTYVFGMGFALGYPGQGPGAGNGATGTQMFGTRETGATDTADDLILEEDQSPGGDPPEGADGCADARESKLAAKQRFAKKKRQVKQLKRKVKRKSGKRKRKLKRKLRRKQKAKRAAKADLRDARDEVAAECGPAEGDGSRLGPAR